MCKDVGASSQSNLQKSKGFSGVKTDIVIELLRCINDHLFCLKTHFSIKVAEKKKKKKIDQRNHWFYSCGVIVVLSIPVKCWLHVDSEIL